eukprot:1193026-Prorocentrum_minimum.AAC.1
MTPLPQLGDANGSLKIGQSGAEFDAFVEWSSTAMCGHCGVMGHPERKCRHKDRPAEGANKCG